jgi:hypothetical protein
MITNFFNLILDKMEGELTPKLATQFERGLLELGS